MKPFKDLVVYTIESVCQIKYSLFYSLPAGLAATATITAAQSINVWIQMNIDYIMVAGGSVAIAQVLGSLVHWLYKDDFDLGKNIIGFCIMTSMVVAVGLLMEGMAYLTKEENFIFMYLRMVGRLMVIIYPIRSALRNVYIITNGAFPPKALIGKMDRFNETLDVNEFKAKDNSENNMNQNIENHE